MVECLALAPKYWAAQTIIYKNLWCCWIEGSAFMSAQSPLPLLQRAAQVFLGSKLPPQFWWECQSNSIPPTPYEAHDPSQAHLVSLSHDGEFSAEKNWNSSKMEEFGPIDIGPCFLDPSVLFSWGLLFRLCLRICETLYNLPFFWSYQKHFLLLAIKTWKWYQL